MYNRYLDIFVIIAESGSITKAADKLYISTTALNKQLRLFEDHLGLKLFERNAKGVILTDAGQYLYQEAKNMIQKSELILQKAHEIASCNEYVIRLGTSLINNGTMLFPYIGEFTAKYPNISFQMVRPPAQNKGEYLSVINRLGKDVDIFLRPTAMTYGDQFCNITLKDLPTEIVMSRKHPLAKHKKLSIKDLHSQKLIMLNQGIAYDSDQIRALIESDHPEIEIVNVKYYSNKTFEKMITDNCLLIHSSYWLDAYPMFTSVPVDWDYTIPYGVVYPKNPPYAVALFIEFLNEKIGNISDTNK